VRTQRKAFAGQCNDDSIRSAQHDRHRLSCAERVTRGFSLQEWDEAIKVADSLDSIKVLMKPHA
jgi:hypothetical protein